MAKTSGKAASEAGRALSQLGAAKGGRARADRLTPEQRKGIASKAAAARWGSAPPADRSGRGRRRVGPGQYRGHLDAEDFALGWHLCSLNARSLVLDALTMHQLERHESSTLLSFLAVEEAAKPPLLLNVFLARNNPAERLNAWNRFRNHEPKTEWHWEALSLRPENKKLLEDRGTTPAHLAALSSLSRERVTYVDRYDGRQNWSIPNVVATESFSRTALRTAFYFMTESWCSLRGLQQTIPGYAARSAAFSDWPRLSTHLGRWLATEEGAQLVTREEASFEGWRRLVETYLARLDQPLVNDSAGA